MTVVGPLTTTFRAPSSCTTSTPQLYQIWSGSDSSYVEGPLFTADSDCFPSGYDPAPTNYYSPGWCPYGYTTACSSLASASTETETAVVCCPTHFSYACAASPSSDQPWLACTTAWPEDAKAVLGVTVVSDGTPVATTVVEETANTISAYGIQVRYKSSDPTPELRVDDSGFTVLSRPSPTPVPIPTQLLVPTQASSSSSSGLSTPAVIGIGVGSAVAALLLAGAVGLFFFLRWRRKRRSLKKTRSATPPPVPPKELPGSPIPYHTVPPLYELPEETSPRRPQSMSVFSKRHLSMSPAMMESPTGRGPGRGDSEVLGGYQAVELEAPSEASLRDRASPESESSGWTDRQARGGTMPMPWI